MPCHATRPNRATYQTRTRFGLTDTDTDTDMEAVMIHVPKISALACLSIPQCSPVTPPPT